MSSRQCSLLHINLSKNALFIVAPKACTAAQSSLKAYRSAPTSPRSISFHAAIVAWLTSMPLLRTLTV